MEDEIISLNFDQCEYVPVRAEHERTTLREGERDGERKRVDITGNFT